MSHPWSELKWWNSGERQAAEEKYDDLVKSGKQVFPAKNLLYKALSATPEGTVRVVILGQDPYPGAAKDGTPYATGPAFSIPVGLERSEFPQTLRIIFGEYVSDLGLPSPSHGDLSAWTRQGVLLWNAIPCVQSGRPLSCDWVEWESLTGEITQRLNDRGGVVFVCLGAVAYAQIDGKIDLERNRVIRTSHPSPRGIRSSKSPFTGSRIFSTINARLSELQQPTVDWRLNDVGSDSGSGGAGQEPAPRGRVLDNITGARLGGLKKQGTSPNIYTSFAF